MHTWNLFSLIAMKIFFLAGVPALFALCINAPATGADDLPGQLEITNSMPGVTAKGKVLNFQEEV